MQMASSTAMTVTAPVTGRPSASRTVTCTGRAACGRLVAGASRLTCKRRPAGSTGMAMDPAARWAGHTFSATAGRIRVTDAYTFGVWSARNGSSTSAVFFSRLRTRCSSTWSDSRVSRAVPLKGALIRSRAVSPG